MSVRHMIQFKKASLVAFIQAGRGDAYASDTRRTIGRVFDLHLLWVVYVVVQLVVARRVASAMDLDYFLVGRRLDRPQDSAIVILLMVNQFGHGIACTGLECTNKTD